MTSRHDRDAAASASAASLGPLDIHLFREGTHARLYDKLGAQCVEQDGTPGVTFTVWAPNAASVSVIGDFNDWTPGQSPLESMGEVGLWRGFVPEVAVGARYKYHIASTVNGYRVDKADPFALRSEAAPATASIVWNLDYTWGDEEWVKERNRSTAHGRPFSIYEVHLGSWRRDGDRMLSFRELTPLLIEHAKRVGFTHIELMPITEHPFYGSWGYETTGYFATTSRYGTPQDLMFLIDSLHQAGVGVILDWVPAHFPTDEHGLGFFDGTHLYEHADPKQGFHPEWNTAIFNYGRNEVRSFLLSSALFWIEKFHVDGLRVDGVASMLYLDYGRKEGEWIANEHGGRENLQAVAFLKQLNEVIASRSPSIVTIAEESTSWPHVTGHTDTGGLGFTMKWDLGWMHDTLEYLGRDPVVRKYHHNQLTFRGMYAWSEAFVLPLSHDEVVHGKGTLLDKMWGDEWQRYANLRLLLAYMFAQPGKKLLFMGSELAPLTEWNHDVGLNWGLRDDLKHRQVELLTGELNRLYRSEPSLHELDFDPSGFVWIEANDGDRSIVSFVRRGRDAKDTMAIVFNFTPVPRDNLRIGVPFGGHWDEILNTDALELGGSGRGSLGSVEAAPVRSHGREWSVNLELPPLAAIFLRPRPKKGETGQ